jgi:hypothetical protein
MRSTRLSLLLAASLVIAAPALAQPGLAPADPGPLPGLSEEVDQSLWCATMASQLAQSALSAGDQQTYEAIAPLGMQLSRQVSTFFVALHIEQPEVETYLDLYSSEITAVLAGTAPERYAPEQCQALVVPHLLV